ncbi:MAG TPA: MarR family transcriptional regulator [Bryobacteraceae bacterium]|nr:MarR family transcriptional regulator [Bryobacteraceae bacterium]
MAGKILKELQQGKPFRHIEEEVFLNVQRTADAMLQELLDVLRPVGLSVTQYNVLRILRGAGDAGVTCKDIGARMITRDPDITRLLDRLERRSLLTRNRAKEDRRFVSIRITEEGLELLKQLDVPVEEKQVAIMRHMSEPQLASLIDLLEQARDWRR